MLKIPRYVSAMTTKENGRWIDEKDLRAKVIDRIKELREDMETADLCGDYNFDRERYCIAELQQDFGIKDSEVK